MPPRRAANLRDALRQHVPSGPNRKIHALEAHLLHGLRQLSIVHLRQMLGKKAERRVVCRGAGPPAPQRPGSASAAPRVKSRRVIEFISDQSLFL